MAAEPERLIAQRTALLARCQAARETRRRRELFEAREAVLAAEAQRDAADQALLDGARERIEQLRAHYDGLRRATAGVGIEMVRHKEEELARAQVRREGKLKLAVTNVERALAAGELAEQAYALEAQRLRKREKLADRMRLAHRRALSEAEESAVEDELSDRTGSQAGQGPSRS